MDAATRLAQTFSSKRSAKKQRKAAPKTTKDMKDTEATQ